MNDGTLNDRSSRTDLVAIGLTLLATLECTWVTNDNSHWEYLGHLPTYFKVQERVATTLETTITYTINVQKYPKPKKCLG